VRTLERHGPIGESERVSRKSVTTQKVDTLGHAVTSLIGPSEMLRARVQMNRQPVDTLFQPRPLLGNPLPVGDHKRLKQRWQLAVSGVAEHIHAELEPAQELFVFLRWRAHLRKLSPRQRGRFQPHRPREISLRVHRMHRDVVADPVLDPTPVGDGEQPVLKFGGLETIRARNKDRASPRRVNRQLRLEEPGAIAILVRLRLFVAQEQCHRPLAPKATHDRLDPHVWNFRIGRPHDLATRDELELERPAAGQPLPDASLTVRVLDPLVAPPQGLDVQLYASAIDTETQAERGREERLLRRLWLDPAILLAVISRRENLVGICFDGQPARRQQTDEIPISRLLSTWEDLVVAACRTKQVSLDELHQPAA
jgi:hypothetical protein